MATSQAALQHVTMLCRSYAFAHVNEGVSTGVMKSAVSLYVISRSGEDGLILGLPRVLVGMDRHDEG